MNRTIWMCWFQGRHRAPRLVERCIRSWERRNPGWRVRVLDQETVPYYIDLPDLRGKTVEPQALSDIVRLLLLAEYGGVWADATLCCMRPLDQWLGDVSKSGFFAFETSGRRRRLLSSFIAGEVGNYLVDRWCASTLEYWAARGEAHDYFWCHELFANLCETDRQFRQHWEAVPKISSLGPHQVQRLGMFRTDTAAALRELDPHETMYKLTHRFEPEQYRQGTLVWHLLESSESASPIPDDEAKISDSGASGGHSVAGNPAELAPNEETHKGKGLDGGNPIREGADRPTEAEAWTWASLKVSTRNLGNHIQTLAAKLLLGRRGIKPTVEIDGDHDIRTCRAAPGLGPIALLINGWFTGNGEEWPPNDRIVPVFLGFHIGLEASPESLSEDPVRYYRKHGPIGCSDPYTCRLLEHRGIESFESHCLSLLFRRRLVSPKAYPTVFAVSHDKRIRDVIPEEIGPTIFISHTSNTHDYRENERRARALLKKYRSDATLIVTTLLHCALPAIAMGIPVVAFYPVVDGVHGASDRERFSGLASIIPVYTLDEVDRVDWNPEPVDVSALKLDILDQFRALSARWPIPATLRSRKQGSREKDDLELSGELRDLDLTADDNQ